MVMRSSHLKTLWRRNNYAELIWGTDAERKKSDTEQKTSDVCRYHQMWSADTDMWMKSGDNCRGSHKAESTDDHALERRSYDAEGDDHALERRSYDAEDDDHTLERRSYDAEGNDHALERRSYDAEGDDHALERRSYDAEGDDHRRNHDPEGDHARERRSPDAESDDSVAEKSNDTEKTGGHVSEMKTDAA